MDLDQPFIDCRTCGNPFPSQHSPDLADLANVPPWLREACWLCGFIGTYERSAYYLPSAQA
jgi:hypothetical protein